MIMRLLVLSLLSFLVSFQGLSQVADSLPKPNAEATPVFYLVDTKNPDKKVKIDPRGTLTVIQYETDSASAESNTVTTEVLDRYAGNIDSLTQEVVYMNVTEETHEHYFDYALTHSRVNMYHEPSARIKLNINEIDGVYYSSRRRQAARGVMFSVLGVAAFTTLVAAPLASLEYRKTSATDGSGFDRPMYFAIAGAGLLTAAVSIPIIYLLRPKYYSFNGDNFSSSKKRWKLAVQ